MNETIVTLLASDLEGLNKPPHVLSQLIDMITGQRQLPSAQQEQRWSHLAECVHCQTFLAHYLIKVIEYKKAHGESEGVERQLLTQLTHIMHEAIKDDIPAYAEALVERGEGEANLQFPLLKDHLQACKDCQLAVHDLHSWLVQSGEAGLLQERK